MRDARLGVNNLFTTRERLALSSRRVREIFKELGEQARIPNCHPHRTRHTSASEFLAERPGARMLTARVARRVTLNPVLSRVDAVAL